MKGGALKYQLFNSLPRENNQGFHGKNHGTQSVWLLWESWLHGKTHGGIHGKTHVAKFHNFQRWWPAPWKQLTCYQLKIQKLFSPYLLNPIEQICWHQGKGGKINILCQNLVLNLAKTWIFLEKVKVVLNLNWTASLFKWILMWWVMADLMQKFWERKLNFWRRPPLKTFFGPLDSRWHVWHPITLP